MEKLTFVSVSVIALVHLIAGKLHFLERIPRSIWFSAAGGIFVAYVFLHLLSELAREQNVLREAAVGPVQLLKHPAYLVALAGRVGFLGGGIIVNVLKEELPAERQSRFSAFLLAL